jgi:glutathione S-transferase
MTKRTPPLDTKATHAEAVRARGKEAQAERARKAQAQHEEWAAKADAIAQQLGVRPAVRGERPKAADVDFRIAYAKTLRRSE